MKLTRHRQDRGAFDFIEEATQLLRTAPAATLAVYYLGAIPFVLGVLFFWADMSRSPFAAGHLADASLAVSILFLWMKFWQSVFARRIRAQLAAQSSPSLNFRAGMRILIAQIILQPPGLFIIPLAILPVLPFGWVYAFYQNATVLSDGEEGVLALFKKSWRQAALWPKQNYLALAILLAFGFYIFLNWLTVCLTLPGLFKMLFGVESAFTKSPMSLLNSTFFAAMFGLTYLCVDPIMKTFYALRCFYGESLQSGEDLKAELKRFPLAGPKAIAAVFLFAFLFLSMPAAATDTVANPQLDAKISTPDLDRAINETIHESKYTWRMPREEVQDTAADEGPIGRFFDKMGEMFRRWARAIGHWLEELWRKLFGSRHYQPGHGSSGFDWQLAVQLLLWGLIAVVAAALAVFLYRVWLSRQRSRSIVAGEAILPVPDIADEKVGADQLPEEAWSKLARELLARGELRLAMRAFYLASLAHLAARNLISIARFKSNLDYERELRRRGHSFPELLSVFGQNISVFERIWYGMHEVNPDSVNQFALNVERMKSGG
jgi:hypothetical protein